MSLADTLHAILITMVECFQNADDAWFRAHGKHGAAWKTRNIIARDRLKTSHVWDSVQ